MNSRRLLSALVPLLVFLSGCSRTEQARFEILIFAFLSFGALAVQGIASGPALFVKAVSGWRAVVGLVGALLALTTAGVLLAGATKAMLGHPYEVRADTEVKSLFLGIVVMGLLHVVSTARLLEVMAKRPKPEDELEVPLMRPIRVVAIPAGIAYVGFAVWLLVRVFAR